MWEISELGGMFGPMYKGEKLLLMIHACFYGRCLHVNFKWALVNSGIELISRVRHRGTDDITQGIYLLEILS